nr:glycosyltransferase [Heyndrickxia coagulans]
MKKQISFVLECIHKLGGTEKATIDLANLLAKNGYKVSIVSLYKNISKEANSYYLNPFIEIKYVYKSFPFLKFHLNVYRFLDFISKRKVYEKVKKLKPDIVFFTDIKQIPFKSSKFKKILMVHNSYEHYRSGRLTRKLLDAHYKEIDKVIFLSKEDLKKYTIDFSADNGEFVYNISQIKPCIRTNFNNKRIVYFGRLENKQKQIDHAIKIVEKLVKKKVFDGWEFHIYGSGPDREVIKNLIVEKKLEKIIILKGTTSEVEKVLGNSDIMILTSDYEGLPMSLLEGASSGLSLVSYDTSPGIHDIIIDNFNGYIIEKNNIEFFTEKIIHLISNIELRKEFGKNGVKHIKENFSDEKIFNKWVYILKNI